MSSERLKIASGKIGIHPYTSDKERSGKTIAELKEVINNSELVLTAHYGNVAGQTLD